MRLVYIAGPYRAKTPFQIQRNIRDAAEVALKYWKLGYAVITPHMNTALLDGEAPDEVWLAGDIEMLARCDGIVMMPRWRESRGATDEHEFARSHGIEIIYEGGE